jgi:sortase A
MSRWRLAARTLGELLITVGLVVLLFTGYELWGTNVYTTKAQRELRTDLRRDWARPTPTPTGAPVTVVPPRVQAGQPFAMLRIPRLGRDYTKSVVEGVDVEDLKKGPGHYPGTALPGQVGNFVLSGHRTTYGAPFNRVDELRGGDVVGVETADAYYLYRITSNRIVAPTAIEVTYPVPGQRAARPSQKLLTMTTCHPKYSAAQRLIVFARFDRLVPKTQGLPAELRGA